MTVWREFEERVRPEAPRSRGMLVLASGRDREARIQTEEPVGFPEDIIRIRTLRELQDLIAALGRAHAFLSEPG